MRYRVFSAVFCSIFLFFQGIAGDYHQFVSVIDAGSTGSRIHVYEVTQMAGQNLPTVKEIYKEKVNVPLASFENKPQEAGLALSGLIRAAENIIHQQGEQGATPLYIYSTAGMRLLPIETQKQINTSVQAYVENSFPLFKRGGVEVRTISGQEEGFLGWISLNQANGSLDLEADQTVGLLEMGGASTQIAYHVNYTGEDVFSFQVNNKQYNVLSRTFLGAGHRAAMDGLHDPTVCYPSGSPMSQDRQGNYNYTACRDEATQYLGQFHLAQQIGTLPQAMKFYGVSGFYYSFSFFGVPMTEQGLDRLQNLAQTTCGGSWDEMKRKYPTQKPEYLNEYCFAAAYDWTLLSAYGFASSGRSPQLLIVSDRLNNQTVEWAAGLAVSKYLTKEMHILDEASKVR